MNDLNHLLWYLTGTVAFLIGTEKGTWGALDRRGRPLIEPTLDSRLAVIEEIDRLLADTKPVL